MAHLFRPLDDLFLRSPDLVLVVRTLCVLCFAALLLVSVCDAVGWARGSGGCWRRKGRGGAGQDGGRAAGTVWEEKVGGGGGEKGGRRQRGALGGGVWGVGERD